MQLEPRLDLSLEFHKDRTRIIANSPRAHGSLARLLARHNHPAPTRLPTVLGHGDGWVDLDVVAFSSAADLWKSLAASERRMSYGCGAYLGQQLALALHDLHRVHGTALGALSWHNVLLSRDGRISLLATEPLGIEHEIAPEVRAGRAPTPAADVFALWSLFQPLLAVCTLPEHMHQMLHTGASNPTYVETFLKVQQRASSPLPGLRFADMPQALQAWQGLWNALGDGPDLAGWRTFLGAERVDPLPAAPKVVVGPEVRWLELGDGTTIQLGGFPMLRRLVRALICASLARPCRALTTDALITATWPGERMLETAAKNRLYAALSRLRSMGLRELLHRDRAGYRIDPGVRLVGWMPTAPC